MHRSTSVCNRRFSLTIIPKWKEQGSFSVRLDWSNQFIRHFGLPLNRQITYNRVRRIKTKSDTGRKSKEELLDSSEYKVRRAMLHHIGSCQFDRTTSLFFPPAVSIHAWRWAGPCCDEWNSLYCNVSCAETTCRPRQPNDDHKFRYTKKYI